MQRSFLANAIRSDTTVVLRKQMGWCTVIGNRMHHLDDFQRRAVCKSRIEVYVRLAFQSLLKAYHPDMHAQTMRLLEEDDNLSWLRSTMCLQIANVIP